MLFTYNPVLNGPSLGLIPRLVRPTPSVLGLPMQRITRPWNTLEKRMCRIFCRISQTNETHRSAHAAEAPWLVRILFIRVFYLL